MNFDRLLLLAFRWQAQENATSMNIKQQNFRIQNTHIMR